uniref:Galectin n=1 Tax=Anopheles melas TaxID=34690 RepID=A0A182UKH7_9DIPT
MSALPAYSPTGPNTNPRDDTALHISIRPRDGVIIRNSIQFRNWGIEERFGGCPVQKKSYFDVTITVKPDSYGIAVNGAHYCDFNHRMPFNINLQYGPEVDPRDDTALHLSIRPGDRRIVRNTYVDQCWQDEERSGGCPVSTGEPFTLEIRVKDTHYSIRFNDEKYCTFSHRMPFEMIYDAFVLSCIGTQTVIGDWHFYYLFALDNSFTSEMSISSDTCAALSMQNSSVSKFISSGNFCRMVATM